VDFVVAGILIGAFLVGIGLAVRDLGARKRPRIARNDPREIKPETLARAWRRFCQSAGTLLMTLGLLILLGTVLAMVIGAGDRTGMIVVAALSGVALTVIVFAALTMPKHYRQGRFDPAVRQRRPIPRSVIQQDVSYRISQPAPASAPDPFELEGTADSAPPRVTVEQVANALPVEAEATPSEPSLLSAEPAEQLEALWPAEPAEARLPDAREAVDLDDELPAWGAPRTEPEAESAPERATAPQRRRQQPPGGFESSLFEDLPVPESDDPGTSDVGPFRSRLLNELAGDEAGADTGQSDVLLNEFPLPARDERDGRNAGNGR
jgi:hypothetical protein